MRTCSFVIVAWTSVLAVASCASSPTASATSDASGASEERPAQIAAARAQLDELTSAWSSYSFSAGRCPQGLDDLLHPPNGEPLIAAMPVDPWGQPIAFMPAAEGNAAQLVSAGPDGELLTDDDVRARASCTEP